MHHTEQPTDLLSTLRLELLRAGVAAVQERDVARYLELRFLLKSGIEADRPAFERKFSGFYGMQRAVTNQFRQRYFDLLFALKLEKGVEPPYRDLLLELYHCATPKGPPRLEASFVSKLVAIHDERQPLWDVYVRSFFGLEVPSIGSLDYRIAMFINNLDLVRGEYERWSENPDYRDLLESAKRRIPQLNTCLDTRIFDFIVWSTARSTKPRMHVSN